MGEASFAPDLCLDRELCPACGFLSTLAEAQDWNRHWIVCSGGCGEAFHRACAPGGPPPGTPIPHGCSPSALTTGWQWSCPGCRRQSEERAGDGEGLWIEQCYVCHGLGGGAASNARNGAELPLPTQLWSRYHFVCTACQPVCISCTVPLGHDRALESKWCRRCRVAALQGSACPVCERSYAADETDMVQCDTCAAWVHLVCTGAGRRTFEALGSSDAAFFCARCTQPPADDSTPHVLRCYGCMEEGGLRPLTFINPDVPGALSLWCHRECLLLARVKLKYVPAKAQLHPCCPPAALCRRGSAARQGTLGAPEAATLFLRDWLHSKHVDLAGLRASLRVTYRLDNGPAGFALQVARPAALPPPWRFPPLQAPTLQDLGQQVAAYCRRIRTGQIHFARLLRFVAEADFASAAVPAASIPPAASTKRLAPQHPNSASAAQQAPKRQASRKAPPAPPRPGEACAKAHASDNTKDLPPRPVPVPASAGPERRDAPPVASTKTCARCRGYAARETLQVPRKPPASEDAPLQDDAAAKFDPNHVPVRLVPKESSSGNGVPTKLGSLAYLPVAMAYRQLPAIAKRDLYVAKSQIAGFGLYVARRYVSNELVIEYCGEVIGHALADRREATVYGPESRFRDSCYMFGLDDQRVIDATLRGNAARFINHCCQPNCKTRAVPIDGQTKILVVAKRDIQEGEELSYDYQFAIEHEESDAGGSPDGTLTNPASSKLPCYCGAKRCRGWMN